MLRDIAESSKGKKRKMAFRLSEDSGPVPLRKEASKKEQAGDIAEMWLNSNSMRTNLKMAKAAWYKAKKIRPHCCRRCFCCVTEKAEQHSSRGEEQIVEVSDSDEIIVKDAGADGHDVDDPFQKREEEEIVELLQPW